MFLILRPFSLRLIAQCSGFYRYLFISHSIPQRECDIAIVSIIVIDLSDRVGIGADIGAAVPEEIGNAYGDLQVFLPQQDF